MSWIVTSFCCCFDLAVTSITYSLFWVSLCPFPQCYLLCSEGGLSIEIWRKSGLCPWSEGALTFFWMTTFASAVHSSSNSVVLWVSSSAWQTTLLLARHLQDKFSCFLCKWMLPNCARKMGTGDYLCIAMSGGAPWGFRLQGGKEQKQPLQIAKVGPWQKDVTGVSWTRGNRIVCLNIYCFQ